MSTTSRTVLTARRRPPGTHPLPFIGDVRRFARDPLDFMTRLHHEHGDIAAWSLGPRRQVMLFHPDHVEQVLMGTNTVLRKGFSEGFTGYAGLIGANGLASSEGQLWKRQRKLVQPAMHPRRIAGYTQTMTRYASELADSWRDGETRDVHRDMVRLTQRIAVRTLFGAKLGERDGDAVKDALDEMARLNDKEFSGLGGLLPVQVPTANRRRLRAASARVEELIMAAVDHRRRRGDDARHDDLLAILLDARDDDSAAMPERQLRDEIHILYVAGHETTSNTLGFTWAVLARQSAVREALDDELDRVLRGAPPTFDHVRELRYTEALIKETLRLYPIAPMLPRKVNTALEVGGYTFGRDEDVWVSQWVTQRDPRWYPDAHLFRPQRWLDGSAADRPRFAWFPFGGGPRVCYGQRFAIAEAVLILATLAQRFVMRPATDAPFEVRASPLLHPRGGTPVTLRRRPAT